MKDGFDIRILFLKGMPEISENERIILSYWHYTNGRRELIRYETGWTWDAIMLYLFSAWWCLGTVPIWCPEGTLATTIKTVYEWTQKEEQHGAWIKRLSKTTILNKPDILVEILSKFPSMGEKTAKEVLKQRGTLQSAFTSAIEEPKKLLKEVRGMGKVRVDGLRKTLLREYKE